MPRLNLRPWISNSSTETIIEETPSRETTIFDDTIYEPSSTRRSLYRDNREYTSSFDISEGTSIDDVYNEILKLSTNNFKENIEDKEEYKELFV